MRQLSLQQEVKNLRRIYGSERDILGRLTDSFTVIQSRAQLLLSLIALCLTITGFSGPKIAAANDFSRYAIVFGLFFVLLSALLLLSGPLQLRWVTQYQAETDDETISCLLQRRNSRSQRYHLASLSLIVGLGGYVGSVICFLLNG
jgi:hypothetical protein